MLLPARVVEAPSPLRSESQVRILRVSTSCLFRLTGLFPRRKQPKSLLGIHGLPRVWAIMHLLLELSGA